MLQRALQVMQLLGNQLASTRLYPNSCQKRARQTPGRSAGQKCKDPCLVTICIKAISSPTIKSHAVTRTIAQHPQQRISLGPPGSADVFGGLRSEQTPYDVRQIPMGGISREITRSFDSLDQPVQIRLE
jgi:hypothetical protein